MLTPADLLNLAEAFAARIPRTPEYASDWNTAWRAMTSVRLHVDDIEGAARALNHVDEPCAQAHVRVEAALWTLRHPASAIGRDILRDTMTQISALERWWSRSDVADLAAVVAGVVGVEHVETLARQLEDPFTAVNVHVTLADVLSDAAAKREQLLKAEAIAAAVRDGNRDYAVRSVFVGYRQAGFVEDAERVRHLALKDPDDLTREERAILEEAGDLLAKVDTILEPRPTGTSSDRLRRLMEYRFNDLKVLFLTETAMDGNLDDPDIEAQIQSDAFHRIGPPRAPRLRGDMASLDAAGLARHLFARPVCQHNEDRAWLESDDGCGQEHDAEAFVRTLTALFDDFGTLAAPFSRDQVDQGLWFVLGHPFWLHNALVDPNISLESRERCVRAMIHPFRDYYLLDDGAPIEGDVFFMWWDLVLTGVPDDRAGIDVAALDIVGEILQLPAKPCQFAALHGLNHLQPNEAAAALVRSYVAEHTMSLTADEIAWVEACASGKAP